MRSLIFFVVILLVSNAKADQWQVGPCGRGGLCVGQYTVLPTPTQSPTANPNAPTSLPTATPTVTRTPQVNAIDLRVDVGASQGFTDSAGRPWNADLPYQSGGYGFVVGQEGQIYSSQQGVSGTSDAPLYQSMRESSGSLQYSFDVPPGNYQVIFKFADLSAKNPGDRLLTLKAQGAVLTSGLDVLAVAGCGSAYDLSYDINVVSGPLNIQVSATAGRALLNAIEVRGLQPGPMPTASPSPTFTPNPTPLDFTSLLPLNAVQLP